MKAEGASLQEKHVKNVNEHMKLLCNAEREDCNFVAQLGDVNGEQTDLRNQLGQIESIIRLYT